MDRLYWRDVTQLWIETDELDTHCLRRVLPEQ